MSFQSRHFLIGIKLNKTKSIVYNKLKIGIDYDVLKKCSDYFKENDQLYINAEEIPLLVEENALFEFPHLAINDFVNCCQNQDIEISPQNIFYLNYLAKKYRVKNLEKITLEIISENKGELALQSLLFNIQANNDKTTSLVPTNEEEELIAQNFEEYMENDQLIRLPISILYRIVKQYYLEKMSKIIENSNNSNDRDKIDQFTKFLFRLLDERGREASVFFEFFIVEKNRNYNLIKLRDGYSDIFDVSFLNKSLLNTTIELIEEMNKLKDEFTNELAEMKKISEDQKSQIQSLIEKQNKEKLEIEKQANEKESNLLDLIKQIKCEMEQMKKVQKCLFIEPQMNSVLDKNINYLIPTGKKWNQKSKGNDDCFIIEDNTCEVSSSSHDTGYFLYYLFDGQKEQNSKYNVWTFTAHDTIAFIKIEFTKGPVIINVIKMTSRNGWSEQTPTHFELFGINDQNQEKSLTEIIVNWENDQTKLFPFTNDKPYSKYEFKFYKFNAYAGIAELNLGKI